MDIKHFLHEHHLLYDDYSESEELCNICNQKMDGLAYSCERCKFWLHNSCVHRQLPPQISAHPFHSQHKLSLLWSNHIDYICAKCFNLSRGHRYYCKDCDFSLEYPCAFSTNDEKNRLNDETPKKVRRLNKSLTLFNYRRVRKYEYTCSWCEMHLSGMSYGCLDEDMKLDQGSTSSLLDSEASMSKVQIEHFDHLHLLSYNEAIEQNENLLCNACRQEIFDQHYACEDCKYYLHEMCTTLSYEVSHPLHRQHPLKLFTDIVEFTCHGCRDHSGGFAYMCLPCDFQLDVKCATSPILPKNERQKLKEMEKVSKVCPFNQNHKLDFFNHRPDLKDLALACDACKLPILGPGYTCRDCFNVKIHESCLALMREMQLTFHPLHPLYPQIGDWENCSACRFKIIERIGYSCRQCDFHLHLHCANSLKLALKIKSHMHNLYYFGPDYEKSYHLCNKCKSYI
ncbi:hypothetical protein POUND7_003974, partial [Theobroma cacao]